jgi:hypothetical protein
MGRVSDVVAQRSSEAFVGRGAELATLLGCLEPRGPIVILVHGIAGVGKSTLLDAFAARARSRHATVVRIDCRTVEPTERGFLQELKSAVGGHAATVPKLAARLARLGRCVVLTLDTYEVFRLMDTWLRQVLVPALPDNVRVIVAGREPPVAAWQSTPGWQALFRSLPLHTLPDADSLALLHNLGVDERDAYRIHRFAHGHPLSLQLAASALRERPDLDLEDAAIPRVVEELTRTYLSDVADPLTRNALDAASVLRRTTQSVLHAMLPSAAPQDAFDRLRALPFVDRRRDGLIIHDAVQRAIAATLRVSDPSRHRAYRRAAWQHFRADLRTAAGSDLWRTTADVLFLIENPVLRTAFFPEEAPHYAVEPAGSDDFSAIQAIALRHDGPHSTRTLDAWWEWLPHSFSVVRGQDGGVAGFYCMATADRIGPHIQRTDPVARAWIEYLRQDPVTKDERVLLLRRWLSLEHGELPSPVQAACWLDCKRAYLTLRPALRRIVTTVRELPLWVPIVTVLGFRPLDFTVDLDDRRHFSAVLDFGPSSVDGWLSGLLAAEIGATEEARLDEESREVVVGDRRIALSPLEFEVLRYLWDNEAKVVDRAALLEACWQEDYDGGSNVVDVVMRGLRRKLGDRSGMIETRRGAGYRFRRA